MPAAPPHPRDFYGLPIHNSEQLALASCDQDFRQIILGHKSSDLIDRRIGSKSGKCWVLVSSAVFLPF